MKMTSLAVVLLFSEREFFSVGDGGKIIKGATGLSNPILVNSTAFLYRVRFSNKAGAPVRLVAMKARHTNPNIDFATQDERFIGMPPFV